MKSFLEFFSREYSPSTDQLGAAHALDQFLDSDTRCFLLKGYAGTGKTFLTKAITQYLGSSNLNAVLLAPTGRAARILAERTKLSAATIHKGIYNLKVIDEIEINKNGKVSYKFRYKLNEVSTDIRQIYIVDEASMISDKKSEEDFFVFGSGQLLSDLMTLIALNNEARYNKIIFIGDQAQLPPVGDKVSGALSGEYLASNFDVKSREYQLTEVVRQQGDSGIQRVATQIRSMLTSEKRNSFQLAISEPTREGDRDTFEISREQAVELFAREVAEYGIDSSVLINFSNADALDYNLQIKKVLHGAHSIVPGDILMINQNNYNYVPELYNGMLVTVIDVSPEVEVRSLKSYDQRGQDCMVTHKFRRVTIRVQDQEEHEKDISCLILENFLYSPERALKYEENIALYIDFKMRNSSIRVGTPEFKEALRKDLYFNALRVKFGYSVTCHKAQGGEWHSVFVNLNTNSGQLSDGFLRWAYTAVTRAKRRLYLFDIPNTSQFAKLVFQRILLSDEVPVRNDSVEVLEITPQLEEVMASLGISEANDLLREKFFDISARLQSTEITIANRKGHQYQEVYTFTRGNSSTTVGLFYNGKGQFNKIQSTPNTVVDTAFTSEVIQILEKPFSFQIRKLEGENMATEKAISDDAPEDTTPNFFTGATRYLQPLFSELHGLLEDQGITICKIDHNSYQERYYFIRASEKACVNFSYDSVGRFTYAVPQIKECNSNPLLVDIENTINSLKKS